MPYNESGVWVAEGQGVLQQGTEMGQQVAEAAGVAYEDIGKPTSVQDESLRPRSARFARARRADKVGIPGYDPRVVKTAIDEGITVPTGISGVTEAKSTVAGQLASLLGDESEYIQQARAKGEEQAAARGMLSSSMAARSAERAAIESALPIAQQDARTFAAAEAMEQKAKTDIQTIQAEAITSGEIIKQKAAIEQSAQNIQNQFQAAMQGASEANKVRLQDMMNVHQTGLQELQGVQQASMQEAEYSAITMETLREANNSVMQNYQISVENLISDPEFVGLGTDAMNNAINELQNLAKNTILFNGASAGIDLSAYVDAYLGDIEIIED